MFYQTPGSKPRPAWARYSVAVGSVGLACLARHALTPGVGPTALPFIFFFPAVTISAWYGGLVPGLVSILLSLFAANWFFVAPTHTFSITSTYDLLAMLAFALASLVIVAAIETMHRARARLVREIAEHHRAEKELAITVASIGDAVIVTNADGNVTFLNSEAERLTKWKHSEAGGHPLPDVFHIVNEKSRQPTENPVQKVFRTGKVTGLANHTVLIAKDGTETPIDDSAAPIRDPDGPIFGAVLVFRDVTTQRKAQGASARLAAIVEHSGDAIFTKDLNGVVRTWNASAERLFGYRPDEIIGRPVTVLFPPDRLSEEDQILDRLRQGQPVERLETVRVAKDGRRIPVVISISPLRDADGDVIGASKIIHDITDLVAARDALAREKELLATTLASIGDAVIATDAQGRITFLNGEAERLTKWKTSEAAGQPLPRVFSIVNEDTHAPVEDPVEKVLRLGAVVGLANHTILIAKDGSETPIDDSAAPIRQPNGPLFGVVLVFRDFTERKNLERKLHELSLFPAQNPAPILRVSDEGTLLYANSAALQDLRHWNLSLGQPAAPAVRSLATEALNAQQASERELLVDHHCYLVSIVPIPESHYANLYWTDITERKRAEEALREAHEELASRAVHLEKLVQQRTARLNEMVGDIEAFSYSIVHDMRSPLRAMQGFAELLAQECAPLTPTAVDWIRRIKTAAGRMDQLIQDGLGYSRVMRADLPLAPVDLAALLRGIVETYPAFQPPHADVELHGAFPFVNANEAALTQCISNLLDNAVKFVARGVKPYVRIWTDSSDGHVRLSFKDNGIGMQKGAKDKIFQVFQRLDHNYEGTGIGLAIVKKAAERMGGKVGFDSEPGKGSTFWLELAHPTGGQTATPAQERSSP